MTEAIPRHIELLAPARDLEAGVTAVNSGADAVYIGAGKFGAREAAGNSLEDIEQLIRHAHLYWARVYVTLNTLLYDHELEEALSLIGRLHDMGIDGLIIQDVSLLECDLPPVPLIASTQMHNDRPEKVAFLEKAGFYRVILARELSLEEIRDIRAATQSIELEFFVHGALCVSYSGQCYISQALGGRSGNRGQCAQPCRRRYQLIDAAGAILSDRKHLLSLRDLNLSGHLGELLRAGVTAFKIEGRLKDAAYVKNVVAYYRQRLDAVLEGQSFKSCSSGRPVWSFSPQIEKTFNRNYTTHFLLGRNRQQTQMETPKQIGEYIGCVAECKRDHVLLQPGAAPLHNGDGITFFDRSGLLQGTLVNRADGLVVRPAKMSNWYAGAKIYRNHDHRFLQELKESRLERKITIEFALAESSEGLLLTATDEDGVQARSELKIEKQAAMNSETARERLLAQLVKTGGTPFDCINVRLDLSNIYHLPISSLNGLRREVLAQLAGQRRLSHPLVRVPFEKTGHPYPGKKLSYRGNVLNRKAADFYRRHGVEEIEPAAESGLDLRGRTVMTTKYCLRYEMGWCDGRSGKGGPAAPLFLVDEDGRRYGLRFDCRNCRMEVEYQG